MYKILLKAPARKELDKIPASDFLKIDRAILSLKDKPYPYPKSKKLKGEELFRLRVGDFRVIYAVDEASKVVTIFRVRLRKDAYR